MSEAERHEALYLNFEDRQEWLSGQLGAMTYAEFGSFVAYVFDQLDQAHDTQNVGEFTRIRGLMLALARKDFEAGHFMDGLEEVSRLQHIQRAEAYYALAQGFYPEAEHPDLDAAWNSSAAHARDFGFQAPGVYESQAPHQVFRLE